MFAMRRNSVSIRNSTHIPGKVNCCARRWQPRASYGRLLSSHRSRLAAVNRRCDTRELAVRMSHVMSHECWMKTANTLTHLCRKKVTMRTGSWQEERDLVHRRQSTMSCCWRRGRIHLQEKKINLNVGAKFNSACCKVTEVRWLWIINKMTKINNAVTTHHHDCSI